MILEIYGIQSDIVLLLKPLAGVTETDSVLSPSGICVFEVAYALNSPTGRSTEAPDWFVPS